MKLREYRKARHLQLCNFFNSACRLVIIELMQQCQEKNLAQMTRTNEIILQKRQLPCKGIARDLRIYGGLIIDLLIRFLFFAVFVFIFMFSAIVKVFRYFWIATSFERNLRLFPIEATVAIYYARFCVFPVNCLSENWFTEKRRDF